MSPAELKEVVRKDLEANGHSLSWFGRPLNECLVEPRKEVFSDSCNNNAPIGLWLVFEETTGGASGYKVVYSEEEEEFGLVVPGERAGVLIGTYGGFVETLISM